MANENLGALQPVHNVKPYKHVEGTHQIEHFFRVVAGLDVDKEDIKRYYNFVEQKMRDLLLMAQRCAKANDRIRVEPKDLPITKVMQESIHAFEALDVDIGLGRILERTVPEPRIDLGYSDEIDARLAALSRGVGFAGAGAVSV